MSLKMIESNFLHNEALKLAEEADIEKRHGDFLKGVELYEKAYQLLDKALKICSENNKLILLKTAASIAYKCGRLEEAKTLLKIGYHAYPYKDTMEVLYGD